MPSHSSVNRLVQSFGFGDVIEVSGLAVAVPEGVVVEVKRPQGGWVFQRHGDRTLLEEVDALKVIVKHAIFLNPLKWSALLLGVVPCARLPVATGKS